MATKTVATKVEFRSARAPIGVDEALRQSLELIASLIDAWPAGNPLPRKDVDVVYDTGCAVLASRRDR